MSVLPAVVLIFNPLTIPKAGVAVLATKIIPPSRPVPRPNLNPAVEFEEVADKFLISNDIVVKSSRYPMIVAIDCEMELDVGSRILKRLAGGANVPIPTAFILWYGFP